MNNQPAVLGGNPIFPQKLSIVRPWLPAFDTLSAEMREIITSRMVTKGSFLEKFEARVAKHLGVKHVVAVSSCTTGLMLVYRCLDLTGEVIVPSFTFMATVSSLVWAGLKPVFVDVDTQTTNIDVMAAEAAITPRTSAIVAVHNFGAPADIEGLEDLCRKRGLKLIFDAAHGMGTLYRNRPVGGFGDAEVFSLSPTKLLIAGEGGVVATDNDDLTRKIRVGREYGNNGHYDSEFAGFNARMPELNALIGLHSLNLLEESVLNRNRWVRMFKERLSHVPGLVFQRIHPKDRSSYKDFSIVVNQKEFGLSRNQLSCALNAENIDTRHYYDPPAHQQTAYLGYSVPKGSLPSTEMLAQNSLSLPIYSQMDEALVEGICRAIRLIHNHASVIRK